MDLQAYLPPALISLQGQTALITGASAGIGLASACALAAEGVHLHLTARRADRLEAIQATLQARYGVTVKIFSGDLSVLNTRETLEQAGAYAVDILVNNAGLAKGKDPVATSDWADWQAMLDTNITAAFDITRRCVPGMLARGQGDIVHMGSIAGHQVYEGGSVYCASKHALRAFHTALRRETCGHNLRAILLAPGLVETEFSQVRFGDVAKAASIYANVDPLTPADIAQQLVFALKQPRHVTLEEITITATAQGGTDKIVRHTAP